MGVVAVAPVTRELWTALEDLFGPAGASNGCWCMYWILGAEYHKRPREKNRQQLRSSVVDGPPPGLVALDESGSAIGWCRLSPRNQLPWLASKRELAPVDDLAVWSLPCFFVRRASRRQGVMVALIAGAVGYARAAGAPALEGYPVDTGVEGATGNLFPGTVGAFAAAGFAEIARRAPDRPVMRRHLDS